MSDNILQEFRDSHSNSFRKVTAAQFLRIWQFYDDDKNGYIEGDELDKLIAQLFAVVNPTDKLKPEEVKQWRIEFMEKYDDNKDGKLEINELVHLLPMEENFLVLFRTDNPLNHSIEFMKLWKEFDADNSGYIEAPELESFLSKFMERAKKPIAADKIKEYSAIILQLFDANGDGKLGLSEMAKLLPVKDNFVAKNLKIKAKISKVDVDAVFANYDVDGSGEIDGAELDAFLRDLFSMTHNDYDIGDLEAFKKAILDAVDKNNDGKLDRDELTVLMMQLNQMMEKK